MGLNPPSSPFREAFALLTVALMLGPAASAGNTYRVLHSFTSGNDGRAPFAGLVMNKRGNLYGTTWGAGTHNLGTVFELTPHLVGTGRRPYYTALRLARVRCPSLAWLLTRPAISMERRKAAAVTELARFLK